MDRSHYGIEYRGDKLDRRIEELLKVYLNLDDDGEMLMPLKRYEIGGLWTVIRQLAEEAK